MVEEEAREKKILAAKSRQDRDNAHLLDETETTLKFGQFMMTLMYARNPNPNPNPYPNPNPNLHSYPNPQGTFGQWRL